MLSEEVLSGYAEDLASSEAVLEADARLDRYLDSYLEAAMDLPGLEEEFFAVDTAAADTLPRVEETALPPRRAPSGAESSRAEPLPAWLRGADEFSDDFDADDQADPPIGLRGLRWIRKNMSSFKVTVSLQRPTPSPGKPRRSP